MRIRKMLPDTRRDRRERWEVSANDGEVLGWLQLWASSRGRRFYRAEVIDPADGERITLESTTDLEESADRIVRFSKRPGDFQQHRRRQYSGHVDDEHRVVHGPSEPDGAH
jgi:hypothetical protein